MYFLRSYSVHRLLIGEPSNVHRLSDRLRAEPSLGLWGNSTSSNAESDPMMPPRFPAIPATPRLQLTIAEVR